MLHNDEICHMINDHNLQKESSISSSRNVGLDVLKVICSIMVVYMHNSIPGIVGDAIYMVCRIAVPLFFIITGFFYSEDAPIRRRMAGIRKILLYFLIGNLIYFGYEFICAVVPLFELRIFFDKFFNVKTLVDFLFLNMSPFSYHLWYLGAILYTLIIMAFVYNKKTKKTLWYFIPLLLCADLVFGEYSVVIFDFVFPVEYVRNFLFVGIPYFLLGTLLRENIHRIEKAKLSLCLLCTILFVLFTVGERYLLELNAIAGARKHNLYTTLLAISVFALFHKWFYGCESKTFITFLTNISQKYSAWIYILHPLFIILFAKAASLLGVYSYYAPFRFIFVYIGTLLFLIFADRLICSFKRTFNTKRIVS